MQYFYFCPIELLDICIYRGTIIDIVNITAAQNRALYNV